MKVYHINADAATKEERIDIDRQLSNSSAIYSANRIEGDCFYFYLEDDELDMLNTLSLPASCRLELVKHSAL